MKVIGVTGGMASGKTTVAKLIARDQFPHLDADALVHQLMSHDKDTIQSIAAAFPNSVVNGVISRAVLSHRVTGDARAVPVLESILHPRVRAAEERAIAEARHAGKRAVVLDIPLLFETGAEALCDVVVAASAPLELRHARAMARPNMTEEKWHRLVSRQLNEAERCARADAVIDTAGSMEETQQQVSALLAQWELA